MTYSEGKHKRFIILKSYIFVMFTLCVAFMGMGSYAYAESVPMIPKDFSQLAESASPAVVNISTEKTVNGGGRVYRHFQSPFGNNDDMNDLFEKFFGNRPQQEYKQRSLGSGFIIDKEGFIVTNNHVVEDTDEIKVILKDGKEYEAKIIGTDKNTDLALIKIEPDETLVPLALGNSDNLKVGEWVVAIGNPFGLGHTVTAGIVSAKGRVIGSGPYDDFIQTDTSINPGNSGGPLIDMDGQVVGINTAIIQSGQGIGFAIPSNLAKGIVDQLKANGNVTRGWLGVSIQGVTKDIADYYGLSDTKGALVMEVFPGDPADKAGIKAKDIIVSIDGKAVDDSRDLTNIVALIPVGEKVKVKILRDGKEKTVTVQIAKRDDKSIAQTDGSSVDEGGDLGLTVMAITPELERRYNISKSSGLLVSNVEAGSPADKAGVNSGDIIDEVNRKPVRSVDDFQKAMKALKKGDVVTMAIISPNRGLKIVKITK